MANGRPGDNPLTDFRHHGLSPFPKDIERLLRRIERLGKAAGRSPLGPNWPFSPREWEWEKGENLAEGRRLLENLIELLLAGRGDEVLIDPITGQPLSSC